MIAKDAGRSDTPRLLVSYMLREPTAALMTMNMGGLTETDLVAEFNVFQALRPDIQGAIVHVILSAAPGETPTVGQWTAITNKTLDKAGYEGCPRAGVIHFESEGGIQHAHVAVCRVRCDGSIALGKKSGERLTAAAAEVEQLPGLGIAPIVRRKPGEVKRRTEGLAQTRAEMKTVILAAAEGHPPIALFLDRLAAAGVTAKPNIADTGKFTGFLFARDGHETRGSRLGHKFAATALSRKVITDDVAANLALRDALAPPPNPDAPIKGRHFLPGVRGSREMTMAMAYGWPGTSWDQAAEAFFVPDAAPAPAGVTPLKDGRIRPPGVAGQALAENLFMIPPDNAVERDWTDHDLGLTYGCGDPIRLGMSTVLAGKGLAVIAGPVTVDAMVTAMAKAGASGGKIHLPRATDDEAFLAVQIGAVLNVSFGDPVLEQAKRMLQDDDRVPPRSKRREIWGLRRVSALDVVQEASLSRETGPRDRAHVEVARDHAVPLRLDERDQLQRYHEPRDQDHGMRGQEPTPAWDGPGIGSGDGADEKPRPKPRGRGR